MRNTLSHPYFDLCYSSSLATISPLISYIPCERGLRYAGQSRMGYFKLIMHGIRMLMPFIDRIAIRAIVGFSLLFVLSALGALASLAVLGAASGALPGWVLPSLVVLAVISFCGLGTFLIAFTLFCQFQGLALTKLNRQPGLAPGLRDIRKAG